MKIITIIHWMYGFGLGAYNLLAYTVTGMMWVFGLHWPPLAFLGLLFLTQFIDVLCDPAFKKERAKHGIPELLPDDPYAADETDGTGDE